MQCVCLRSTDERGIKTNAREQLKLGITAHKQTNQPTSEQTSKRKVETDLYEYAPTDRKIQAISYKKFSEIFISPFFMWLHLFEFGN